MSTLPFYTPLPAFQTADIVSATRLNQALTNLDAVYGLDQRMSFGTTYGRTRSQAGGLQEWRGWVAYRGNQLVIYLSEAGTVEFDYTEKTHKHTATFASAGLKTITLPGGYVEFQVYCVRVACELAPRYAYMTNSNAASIGAMPAFTNGTTSNAAHLNTILTATSTLGEQFNQPIACGSRWSNAPGFPSWLNDQDLATITFYLQHRHTWFQFYMTATSSTGSTSTSTDHVQWEVIDNSGNSRRFWEREILRFGTQTWAPVSVNIASLTSLTVGNWYKFKFTHSQGEGGGENGRCNLYWCGEQRTDTAGLWTPQDRWTLGDTIEGSADGPPQLNTFSANLTHLDGRRNSTNMVMRQSRQVRSGVNETERTEIVHGRRIHRWLAYENATEEDMPTLYYTTDQLNVFSSVTMTKTYTTLYLDLDTTPIKSGMVFYVANCHYAIQVPDHP